MAPLNYWTAVFCKTFIIGCILAGVLLGLIIVIDLSLLNLEWPGLLAEYVILVAVGIAFILAFKFVKGSLRSGPFISNYIDRKGERREVQHRVK